MFAYAYNALLCWFVLRLFMCLLMQHDSRWRHVSLWWDVHRLHVGDMSYLSVCFFGSSLKYLLHLNLVLCVNCASVIRRASQNKFDYFMCMFVLESHLYLYFFSHEDECIYILFFYVVF